MNGFQKEQIEMLEQLLKEMHFTYDEDINLFINVKDDTEYIITPQLTAAIKYSLSKLLSNPEVYGNIYMYIEKNPNSNGYTILLFTPKGTDTKAPMIDIVFVDIRNNSFYISTQNWDAVKCIVSFILQQEKGISINRNY